MLQQLRRRNVVMMWWLMWERMLQCVHMLLLLFTLAQRRRMSGTTRSAHITYSCMHFVYNNCSYSVFTRLSSNLRHLVTHVHFRSCDKGGSYTTRPAIPENPLLHANITALCLIEQLLLPMEVLHCGNRNFRPFLARVTLTLTPWPSCTNSTHIPWRCTVCANMNLLCQGFRKLSSDRPTCVHTDRHDQNYIPCCFTGGQK